MRTDRNAVFPSPNPSKVPSKSSGALQKLENQLKPAGTEQVCHATCQQLLTVALVQFKAIGMAFVVRSFDERMSDNLIMHFTYKMSQMRTQIYQHSVNATKFV